MFKKVLVASIGQYLDEIVENTLDFVGDREVEVIGVYVVDTSAPFLTPSKVKEMMVEELKTKGNDVMRKLENKFQEPNIKFKKVILEGDPADEIVKLAEKENVDIIIMGSGKSKIDKHLLGSVSEKIVHSASCNIFLIKKLK